MYRYFHRAIIRAALLIYVCCRIQCDPRLPIERTLQVDKLPKGPNNAESLLTSDIEKNVNVHPTKRYLIDTSRHWTPFSVAVHGNLFAERYRQNGATRSIAALSSVTDTLPKENSRAFGRKSFQGKEFALLNHKKQIRTDVNDICAHQPWLLTLGPGNMSNNRIIKTYGNVIFWCKWLLILKNKINPFLEINYFPSQRSHGKFGIKRFSKISNSELATSISASEMPSTGSKSIPRNARQNFHFIPAFHSIPGRNAVINRTKRSISTRSSAAFRTTTFLPTEGDETGLHFTTTIGSNNATDTIHENGEETIDGLSKLRFLLAVPTSVLVGLGAAGMAIFFIRRHRRKNDPELQRLLSVQVVSGIYYNQTGLCF